jgi:hypothetical protein
VPTCPDRRNEIARDFEAKRLVIAEDNSFPVRWFWTNCARRYTIDRDMDVLKHIREQVKRDNYEFSAHAEREREDEHILVEELEQSVASGELLEDYPDDPRGHSCLVLGFTSGGRAIHSVWGLLPDERVRVITVYIPLPPMWVDPRTRRSGK